MCGKQQKSKNQRNTAGEKESRVKERKEERRTKKGERERMCMRRVKENESNNKPIQLQCNNKNNNNSSSSIDLWRHGEDRNDYSRGKGVEVEVEAFREFV
jgi:hypothetical protein